LEQAVSVPTAGEQIDFLQQIQRLFAEGEFQATYKYALLLTLAELAVEHGDDSGAELDLPMPRVAEKFAELYWRQASPYQSGQHGTVASILSQNLGAQAAVVNRLAEIHQDCGGQFSRARLHPNWKGVLSGISSVIRNMPLRYLQIIGGKQVPFLYDYPARPGLIRLKSGVAFNLRRYQMLIQQLARAGWVDHVRGNSRNTPMLGQLDDLESFMFGSKRASLGMVVPVLAKVQSDRCFYCSNRLQNASEVDHFIPWARYPRDTAHNFVLAHRTCNKDKRELLAARQHLEHWLEQIRGYGDEIGGQLAKLGFVSDAASSKAVTRWAYEQAVTVSAHAWAGRGVVVPVGPEYLEVFRAS
jgi:5-methylcytosine-specific restriction endonuclease McrA